MNSESPYYVTTNAGKLQLMKGCYLTLMKRKNSAAKTLQKTKHISHSYKQSKKTIKKSYNMWKQKAYGSKVTKNEIVLMTAKKNSKTISKNFVVKTDQQVFKGTMMPNIPLIEMDCDNDCDSQWPEIYETVNHLKMSLSLAIYDHMNGESGFF